MHSGIHWLQLEQLAPVGPYTIGGHSSVSDLGIMSITPLGCQENSLEMSCLIWEVILGGGGVGVKVSYDECKRPSRWLGFTQVGKKGAMAIW
jgi:hypothetical protein